MVLYVFVEKKENINTFSVENSPPMHTVLKALFIYPSYSDTSTPNHTCSKILTSTIYYPMCLKIAGRVANRPDSEGMPHDPNETMHSVASHPGLHCLLSPVCPNACSKYGNHNCSR